MPGGGADGVMAVDVRIALKTDDDALIYCSYQGVFKASPDAMARFNRGEQLAEADYRLRTFVRFETGSDRYCWLNDLPAVGAGRQTADGPIYSIFEIL